MQFAANNTPAQFQPVSINLTLETEDEVRWFYHLMNQQAPEIVKGYHGNRKGDFGDRFVNFDTPDKKALFQFVRSQADEQGVRIHL